MAWFIVDFISTALKNNQLKQTDYVVNEEFYLFEANNREELYEKTEEKIELINRLGDDDMLYDEDPATNKALGIRKIYPLSTDLSNLYDKTDPPKDNTIIMRSYYKVASFEDAERLVKVETVDIVYLKDDQLNLAENGKLK